MELVAIGKILKPIGIRGALKIEPLTDTPERFQQLRRVWIGASAKSAREASIRSVETQMHYVVLSVDSIQSVEKAEEFRHAYVFVPLDERIPPKEGAYFIDAIIGCNVYDGADTFIGTVGDVFSMPANDVWLVRTPEKEILLPAVKFFIRNVDVENKRIIIHVIEGLVE